MEFCSLGFWVWVLFLGVWDLKFCNLRIWDLFLILGIEFWCLVFGIRSLKFKIFEFENLGFGFWIWYFEFSILDL